MLKKMSFVGLAVLALLGVLLVAGPAAAQGAVPEAGGVHQDGERPFHRRHLGRGEIVAIEGSSLTVETRFGATVTVLTDDETVVRMLDNPEATVADLAVGDLIGGRYMPTGNENEFLAKRIVVRPEGLGGRIESISGSEIVLTRRDGSTVTVLTSEATLFRVGRDHEATLADFAAGDRVFAAGEVSADGSSVTATHVMKRGQRPMPESTEG